MIGKNLNRETNIVSLFQRHRPGGGRLVGELAPPHPRAPASWEEHRWPCHHQGEHLSSQDCRNFIDICECARMREGYFLKCGILSWKSPCHKWNMNNLQSAKTADCNDFRCDSVRWMWKWGMQNKQTRHRWSHLSMASYSSVLTWCLSYQSTLWPHFHHVETIRIFGIAACISLTEVTRLGINFKYFERLPLANFDEVS